MILICAAEGLIIDVGQRCGQIIDVGQRCDIVQDNHTHIVICFVTVTNPTVAKL